MSIESQLSQIKSWYRANWPLCLFCNHRVVADGQLAHIIRRSWTSNIYTREQLQTMKLNTGLAHHGCHEIFDNDPKQAVHLPRFIEVMFLAWLIDPRYTEEQVFIYDLPDFEKIANETSLHIQNITHHGELLYLPY